MKKMRERVTLAIPNPQRAWMGVKAIIINVNFQLWVKATINPVRNWLRY